MIEHEELVYGVIVEENKKFNIELNDGTLLCEEWFDTYKIDEDSPRVIFGYKVDEQDTFPAKFKYGGTSKNGKLTVMPIYDFLAFNNEDTYTAFEGDKEGYVDSNYGCEITPIIFNYTGRFDNGKAYVQYNKFEGFIIKNKWKLATADGIKYNFNLVKWIDDNFDSLKWVEDNKDSIKEDVKIKSIKGV